MYELIVLGLIPGTQTQITFTSWLIAAISIIGCNLVWSTYRSQALRRTLVSFAFLLSVNHTKHIELKLT